MIKVSDCVCFTWITWNISYIYRENRLSKLQDCFLRLNFTPLCTLARSFDETALHCALLDQVPFVQTGIKVGPWLFW